MSQDRRAWKRPILLGCEVTALKPLFGGRFARMLFLLFTIWVTPEIGSRSLDLRGPSVLPQDFRGPQMVSRPQPASTDFVGVHSSGVIVLCSARPAPR